jgi:hypothetical protein
MAVLKPYGRPIGSVTVTLEVTEPAGALPVRIDLKGS